MIDLRKYLGLPYDINNEFGVNCWGLYALVKKQEQNIDVLMFSAINSSAGAISNAFVDGFRVAQHGHEKIDEPRDFDLVVMTRELKGSIFYHCGVFIDKAVLHAKGENQSGQVWYQQIGDLGRWKVEFWRHV